MGLSIPENENDLNPIKYQAPNRSPITNKNKKNKL
jgi:hypothetical protein